MHTPWPAATMAAPGCIRSRSRRPSRRPVESKSLPTCLGALAFVKGQTRAPGHMECDGGAQKQRPTLGHSLRVSAKTETFCITLINATSGCSFAFIKGQTTALGHTWRDQVLAIPFEFQRQLRQPGRRTGASIPSAAWHRSSASRHSIHAPHLQSRRRSERAASRSAAATSRDA